MAPAVLAFEDPVSLVGEREQPRADPLPLQQLEGGDAFVERDAEIQLPLRDERRRLPLGGVAERALIDPLPFPFPYRAAHAPLTADAPIVHAVLGFVVRCAGVNDETAELVRMAVEPVHEVTAVARAK